EVRAEGDGFRTATDTVDVAVGAVAETTLRLDALPVVTSQSTRTVHIERWFPESPVYQLEIDVEATDPDRAVDVEGAALVVEGLAFREPLFELAPGRFTAALDASQLPGGRVQSLLGRSLRVEVTDHAGNTALGPPLALVRVVEQTPLTFRPQITEVLAQNPPVLEWRPADLPFAFTYRVDVFLEDGAGVSHLVYTRSGLAPPATAHALPSALPTGDYTWTVWVVDEAGNRSRSKPAGFRVP
ncbi:MAG TPA: carboxypeptidase regulatory-like domain-containing protein, partial [Rubricoccaceae bacterium]